MALARRTCQQTIPPPLFSRNLNDNVLTELRKATFASNPLLSEL